MTAVVRAIFPGILLLRLADSKRPGMDKLYFFVRQMDRALAKSKEILDEIEANYNKQAGTSVSASITNYFFSTQKDVADYANEKYTSDEEDDDESDDEGDTDDNGSVSDDDSASLDETETLGDKFVKLWQHRKKKLVHDLSICGWMLSPFGVVMLDAYHNHDGEHRDAVERQLKKWYFHTVSLIVVCNAALFSLSVSNY